jgi:serine/threonine-protein kinase HipA
MLLAPGSSLGGAWPKASVFDKDGSLAIAKFPRKDDKADVVRWEAVALTLAKTAGINVPSFRLKNVADEAVFIVKRFDREGKDRIPFLSAMSMLGAFDKDGLVHSHTEIASALIQHGAEPDKDLEELWRRMIFEIMISNKDNHLRNHGFLYIRTGWVLSPVYDLNPSTEKGSFEVSIDDTGAKNTIPLALKVAENFRLSDARAKEILEEVRTAVADWRKVAKSFDISESQAERMKSAFGVD